MTRRPPIRPLAVLATFLLALGACGSNSDASTSAGPSTITAPDDTPTDADSSAAGMAWRTVEVVDPTRATDEIVDADGETVLEGADTRTIPVELLYEGADGGGENARAASGEARPLVVWMNGLGGAAAPGDPLLLALYNAGFTVAAPNSPEVSAPASSAADFPELPADATAVVDAILHPADGVADDLAAVTASDRIAITGHSIGASAALATAFHDCCRDERISAVIAFGATTGFRFGETDFDYSGTPLLLVHGDADQIAPLAESETILGDAAEPTRLLVLPDADHFDPVYGADTPSWPTVPDAVITFLDTYLADTAAPSSLEAFGATLPDGSWRSPAG